MLHAVDTDLCCRHPSQPGERTLSVRLFGGSGNLSFSCFSGEFFLRIDDKPVEGSHGARELASRVGSKRNFGRNREIHPGMELCLRVLSDGRGPCFSVYALAVAVPQLRAYLNSLLKRV